MQQGISTLRHPLPRRVVAWLALVLAAALFAQPAAAQGPRPDEDTTADPAVNPDRWAAAAEFTLTSASGNQDVTVLTTGFSLKHLRSELFGFNLKLQARYGTSDGQQVVENYQGSFNVDIGPQRRWSPFFSSAAEHDPFKRLDVRISSGAGARYRLYRAENRGEASLSVAMLHSYEALSPDPAATDVNSAPLTKNDALWRLELTSRHEVREGITLTSGALYQPVVNHAGDFLLEFDAALKVMVTKRIALSISHEFDHDSTPPPGVEDTDRLLKAGILIEL